MKVYIWGAVMAALLLAGCGVDNGKGTWEVEHVKTGNQFNQKARESAIRGGLVKIGDKYIYFKGKDPRNGETFKVKEEIIYQGKGENGYEYETTRAEYRFVTKGDMKKLIKKDGIDMVLAESGAAIKTDEYLTAPKLTRQKMGKKTAQADARNILTQLIANM